jgi:fructose-specific phosphotransferase system IIA component
MDLKVSEILQPSAIVLGLDAEDKADALEKVVDLITATGKVKDPDELKRVIFEREKLMSTGIGDGIALPHGKSNAVDTSLAALATLKTPIDFDALDDQPVEIILLLVGTESNVGVHLRLLSRISRMLGTPGFRESLLTAKSVEDVTQLFATQEEERA